MYETDEDSVIVQGYIARDKFEGDFIPAGEDVVQIPKGLLRQLVANGSLD
ncbi:hypothetical protein [Agreia sp. VKM Ac-1783]|nr:hypothetical protein [Agreia sp. VKM Ac-1783]